MFSAIGMSLPGDGDDSFGRCSEGAGRMRRGRPSDAFGRNGHAGFDPEIPELAAQ